MNELVVADRASQWHNLKALVLDSVSSPITRRVYNLGLDEFIAWFQQEPRPAGFTKATVTAWRVALEARGLGPISINVRITAVRKVAVEVGGQVAVGGGTGVGDCPDQGREIAWRPRRQLAVAPSGGGAPTRRHRPPSGTSGTNQDLAYAPSGAITEAGGSRLKLCLYQLPYTSMAAPLFLSQSLRSLYSGSTLSTSFQKTSV